MEKSNQGLYGVFTGVPIYTKFKPNLALVDGKWVLDEDGIYAIGEEAIRALEMILKPYVDACDRINKE